MTTVQNTNTVSNALMDAMNGTQGASSTSAADDTQNRFMTLLVAQMQNQDPLNPMDNSQMTSQLAQLSTVSGIQQLNSTLTSLMGSYQSSQSLQSAAMIGHSVLVPGSSLQLASGSATMGINLAGPADSVSIAVRDSSGQTVHTFNLGAQDAGTIPLQWDGTTDAGTAAPNGNYTFAVTAKANGQAVTATTLSLGQVTSVSTNSQGVKLNVAGIGTVDMSSVQQIF